MGRGTVTAHGYIRLKTKPYRDKYKHRVIWERHRGAVPAGFDVNHVNGNRLDNRIQNLSLVKHERHPFVTFKGKKR